MPSTLKDIEDKIVFAERLANLFNDSFTKKEFVDAFEQVVKIVVSIREQNKKEIGSFREEYKAAKEELGEEGEKSLKRLESKLDASLREKFALVDSRLRELKDGEPGKDADENVIAEKVKQSIVIPTIEELANDLPKLGERIRDGLELLQGDERLNKSAIKGLEEELKRIEAIRGTSRVGGGTSAIGVAAAFPRILHKETPSGAING